MPELLFTKKRFEKPPPCPPDKRRIDYRDTLIPGLFMEVRRANPNWATLYLRFRNTANKTAYEKLGTTLDTTPDEARAKAKKLKAEIALGRDPQAEARERKKVPTWDTFFTENYLPHAKQVKRTWQADSDMHTRRISAVFGATPINRITRLQVQQFHNTLREEGLSPAYADLHLKLIRRALNLAVDWGMIKSNPAAKVRQFNEDNQVERYLSEAELRRLMRVLEELDNRPMACIILWLLSTGARTGEAMAATWADIDRDNRVWVVQSKTSKSKRRRAIPLNDIALSVLDELEARGCTSGHLFVGKRGPYKYLSKNWERICKEADLEGLRLHDLRHNYASMLVNAGHSLFQVQQALGHSDPKVTMRYAHLSQESLQQAANSASERIKAAMSD